MSTPQRPTVRVNVERIVADMLDRGWNAAELARKASLHESLVSRFLRGEHQTPKTLKKVAKALGRKPSDYASVEMGAVA